MSTKVYFIASISALSGLVATSACTTTKIIQEGPTDDAGAGGGDAGGELPPLPEGEPRCNKPNPIDVSKAVYTPGKISKGACSDADITAIQDYVNEQLSGGQDAGAKATFTDLKNFIAGKSANCAACVFTPVTAEAHGPIVEVQGGVVFNLEGCIEAVSGKRECAEAYARHLLCFSIACTDCKTQATADACLNDTPSTSCKASDGVLETACGDTKPLNDQCAPPGEKWPPIVLIKKMCGP